MQEGKNINSRLNIPSTAEICKQRLDCIFELETEFDKLPSIGSAITLRDMWDNWIKENWGNFILRESPSTEEIEEKIKKYSKYIEKNITNYSGR